MPRQKSETSESAAANKVYIEYTESEAEAKAECELLNRRVYIAGLDRIKSAVPVGIVFLGLSSSNAIYKDFAAKSVTDYENWKTKILKRSLHSRTSGSKAVEH